MKIKLIVTITTLIFLGGLLNAHVVKIFRPKAGEVWCKNKENPYGFISYSINDSVEDTYMIKVNVWLYDETGNTPVKKLFSDTTGMGGIFEGWSISDIDQGKYRIKIETTDDSPSVMGPVFRIINNCITAAHWRDWKWLKKFVINIYHLKYALIGPAASNQPCPACGVRFDLGELSKILDKSEIQEKLQLELHGQKGLILKLGTYVPGLLKGKKRVFRRFALPPQKLIKTPAAKTRSMIKPGPGFFLLVKNARGKLIIKHKISLINNTRTLKLRR